MSMLPYIICVYMYVLVMVCHTSCLFYAGRSKQLCMESSSETDESSPQPTKVNQLVKRFEANLTVRPRPASVHQPYY